jgi:hypothetical protein
VALGAVILTSSTARRTRRGQPGVSSCASGPAVAIDASRPSILAAGSNDEIDLAPCGATIFATEESPCPFTPGVGVSGIYFSFNSGQSWVQPTYTGWSARDGTPAVGPIGTLPWYYESGLVSDSDPAVAFGPIPDANGEFSWGNGSRLYYANLTSSFPASLYASGATPRELDEEEAPERNMALREQGFAEPGPLKGIEAIAVSRADNVGAANYNDKNVWKRPIIVSKAAANAQFADKEQIWADNAESSAFFGNVYVCYGSFVGGAEPLIVSTSSDGGSTWHQRQVSRAAAASPIHFGQSGCTIRTNSHGVVYVMYQTFQAGIPGTSAHYLVRSYDGGNSWTRPSLVTTLLDNCFVVDPVIGRCDEDGIAGARNDLSASPNADIANGAPSGAGAPNTIVDNYVTGPALNQEKVYITWSVAHEHPQLVPPGQAPSLTWSGPEEVSTSGDRGFYTAPALSPNGSKLYVVYNAFTTPYRETTFTTRGLVGVFRSATMGASGPSAWSTLNRSAVGDPRASSQNNLQAEFLGDYVYADATNSYGVGVWNDVRAGQVCDAMNEWRMDLRTEEDAGDPPNPIDACPPRFGETDIWSFTTG